MAGFYGSPGICPSCGNQMQNARRFAYGYYGQPGASTPNFGGWTPSFYTPPGYGDNVPLSMGGTYPANFGQGGPLNYFGGFGGGTPDDDKILEMVHDSLDADATIPYDSDISVDVTAGIVTLTGTVPNKRIKHAVGDDVWWIPGVWDINNNLQTQRRSQQAESRTKPAQGSRASNRQQFTQQETTAASHAQQMNQQPSSTASRRGISGQHAGRPYGQY